MSVFDRILFAGDFSGRSRGAFAAACAPARGRGGHLHVLTVVGPVSRPGRSGPCHEGRSRCVLP
jgi:hypothetical protein